MADTIGFEERFAGRELLDEPPISLQYTTNCLADTTVIINDENYRCG